MSTDDRLEGEWTQLKGWAKEQWGRLTDDDLLRIDGSVDRLVGAIQEHYGLERERAQADVRDWNRRHLLGR